MASAAVAAGSGILGTVGNITSNPAFGGQMNGRSFTHWSMRVLQAGALVGIVSCAAALFIQNYVAGALLGVLAICNAIGAYYLGIFIPQGSIEEDADRVEALMHQLDTQNDRLRVVIGHAGDLTKFAAEVGAGVDANGKEAAKLVDRISTELSQKTRQLNQALTQLDRFQQLFGEVEEARVRAVREMAQLADHQDQIEDHLTGLEHFTETLDEGLATLPSDIVQRLNRAQEVARQMEERHRQIENAVQQQGVFLNEKLKEYSQLLEEKVRELDELEDRVADGAEAVGHGAEAIGRIGAKISEDLTATDGALDKERLMNIIRRLTAQNEDLLERNRALTEQIRG